jgi:TP901 family phage tail tape measure protein
MAGEGWLPPVVGLLRLDNAQFLAATRESTAAMKTTQAEGKGAYATLGAGAEKALKAISVASGVAAVASIMLATKFDSAMERVHTQAGASQAEVEKMSGAMLDLAPKVGTGPEKLAESLFHVESIGLRGAKALDTVAASAKLAKVGNADLESTTNAVAAAMVTQMKDATSLNRIVGLLNATIGQGNMKMDDLTAAISTGILPVAKNFGLGLADVGGALAVMTDRGMHADEAATRLKMTMTMMEAPTNKASKALKDIGISSTQLALDMHKPEGLLVALTDLKSHMDKAGLSAVQQARVISDVFGGGRSSAGVQTLMNNLDTLDAKTKGVTAGVGKFGDAWAKTTETAKFHMDAMLAKLQSAGVRLGNDLLPSVVRIADGVAKVADAFSKLPNSAQVAILGIGLTVGPLVKMATLVLKARDAWLALRTAKLAQVGVDATVGAAETGLAAKTAAEGVAAAGASRALGGAGLAGALGKVGIAGLAVAPVMYALTTKTQDFHQVTSNTDRAVQRYGLTLGVGLTALNGAKSGADRMRESMARANVTMVDGRHKALAYHDALERLNMTVHTTVLTTYMGKPAPGTSVPGPSRRMAAGGVLDEPVMGIGMRSGRSYSLGEAGPEAVVPLGGHGHGGSGGGGGGGGGVTVNVYVHGVVGSPQDVAAKLAPAIRQQLLLIGGRVGSGYLSPRWSTRVRP